MTDYRDVAFSGAKVKLTDFLKLADMAKDGPARRQRQGHNRDGL